MNERIHACLDGKISRTDLTDRERRELEELEEAVERSLAPVRSGATPDLAAGVMARIRREEAEAGTDDGRPSLLGTLRGLTAWIWTPRTVRVRPAWALAAVAALTLGVGVVGGPADGPGGADAAVASSAGETPVLYVRFELDAARASSVALAGTFSDWQPRYELAETAPGRWTALVPLRPGVHEYAFIIDGGRWIADPDAPRVRDGFGGVNSQIALVGPGHQEDGGIS